MPTMRYPAGIFLIIGIFPVQAVGQGIEDLFAELAADTVRSEERLSLATTLKNNLDGRFSAGGRRFFRTLGAGEGANLTGDMGSYSARLEVDTWTGETRWHLRLAE